MSDPNDFPQKVAFAAAGGMVASAHHSATAAGAAMLRKGGNAVDAAVASAFALGVCEPQASGIGGQTMMLIHDRASRRTLALDGSSRAPHRTPPAELPRSEQLRGHRATTVPSTPATLGYALERLGTLSIGDVLEPAIALATDGFFVSELQHRLFNREIEHLRERSGSSLLVEGSAPPVGHLLRQPALAKTLERMRQGSVEEFYRGETAELMAADMEAHDGLIQRDDLAQIPWPRERRPVSSRFGSRRVFTFPPPGAGRTLLEILTVLDQFTASQRDPDTPKGALLLAEIIRRANMDRKDRPFDPDFFAQVDDRELLSEGYAKKMAKQVRARVRVPRTSGETTHLSVIDGAGNAVALTQSIERVWGSFEMSPELGFLYNNYLSAFELDDIGHPYYLRPNAVPWASVAPTMVMGRGGPSLVLGSPGSERIASTVAQVLLRLERQSLPDAIAAPRIHCNLRSKVSLEASRVRTDVTAALKRAGYTVDRREPFSFYLGCVAAVARDRLGFIGVADLRRDGSAAGGDPH